MVANLFLMPPVTPADLALALRNFLLRDILVLLKRLPADLRTFLMRSAPRRFMSRIFFRFFLRALRACFAAFLRVFFILFESPELRFWLLLRFLTLCLILFFALRNFRFMPLDRRRRLLPRLLAFRFPDLFA